MSQPPSSSLNQTFTSDAERDNGSQPLFPNQEELLASSIDPAALLPQATPPSTMTEPLFGSSSLIGPTAAIDSTLLRSQSDSNAGRRPRARTELGDLQLEDMLSASDAGLSAATTNPQNRTPAAQSRPQPEDHLSVAAPSIPNQPRGTNRHDAADTARVPNTNERVRVIWGTNIVISDAISAFRSFLLDFTTAHRKMADARAHASSSPSGSRSPLPTTSAMDLEPLYPRLLQQIHDTEIYNLNIDCANLRAFPPTVLLAQQLLHYPNEIVSLMDMVVNEYFTELFPDVDLTNDPIQVRPFNTGKVANMRELDPSDIDKLISIRGLIIRVSNIVPDMRVAYFVCANCGNSLTVENVRGRIAEPSRCPRDGCSAIHSMVLIHNRCLFSDKQIIKIQETPGTLDCVLV